jgi:hypothetical protein
MLKMTKIQLDDTLQNYFENARLIEVIEIVLKNIDTKSKKAIIQNAIDEESNIIKYALEYAGIEQ